MFTQITIHPDMENQALYSYWAALRNRQRKFLTYENVSYRIELSPEAHLFVLNKKRLRVRASFDKYLEGHREAYNKIYRDKYRALKAQKQLNDRTRGDLVEAQSGPTLREASTNGREDDDELVIQLEIKL